MARYAIKKPKNYNAVCALTNVIFPRALMLGPSAEYYIKVDNGCIDADYLNDAINIIEEVSCSFEYEERLMTKWDLAGLYYCAGQYKRAHEATLFVIENSNENHSINESARDQLVQIEAGHTSVSLFLEENPPLNHEGGIKDCVSIKRALDNNQFQNCFLLEASWEPDFLGTTGDGRLLHSGDFKFEQTQLNVALYENDDCPAEPPQDIGRFDGYLVLSHSAFNLFKPYFSDGFNVVDLNIKNYGAYYLVGLMPIDCLYQDYSSTRQSKKGRLIVDRAEVKSVLSSKGCFLQPYNCHEILVPTSLVKILKKIIKNHKFKKVKFLEDKSFK